jgi:mobilome CxxCx(11)CxxC protein
MSELPKIQQQKLNALASKQLHMRQLSRLNKSNKIVDSVALGAPVFYFAVRYLAKGTKYADLAEGIWELLAAALLTLMIVKLVLRWQERALEHSKLMGENISLVGLADNLISNPQNIPTTSSLFATLVQQSETNDRNSLGERKPIENQWAYREALKEFADKNVACDNCGASPWNYTPGVCQMCGGTPVTAGVKNNRVNKTVEENDSGKIEDKRSNKGDSNE